MDELLGRMLQIRPDDIVQMVLIVAGLSTVRLGVMMSVFPLFTSLGVQQGFLRGGLAIGLSLPVMPSVLAQVLTEGSPEAVALLGLVAKEALIGVLLGLLLGLPIWGAVAAGHLLDLQRGAAAATFTDPNSGDETTLFGHFVFLMFTATLLSLGLFERALLDSLYQTFVIWPPLGAWPVLELARTEHVLRLLGAMLEIGLVLSAPTVLAMLTVDLGLALTSRIVPQIDVFFLSMSLKTLLIALVMPLYFAMLIFFIKSEASLSENSVQALESFFR